MQTQRHYATFHWLTSEYMQLASGFMQLAAAGPRRNIVHFHCLFEGKMLAMYYNGDNHIQHFHLGRYIVRYTFGNHFLRLRLRVAVKLNFRPYIQRYTSQNDILNTVIFFLFDSLRPINNLSVKHGQVFLG